MNNVTTVSSLQDKHRQDQHQLHLKDQLEVLGPVYTNVFSFENAYVLIRFRKR